MKARVKREGVGFAFHCRPRISSMLATESDRAANHGPCIRPTFRAKYGSEAARGQAGNADQLPFMGHTTVPPL